jgi:hypothetical protein
MVRIGYGSIKGCGSNEALLARCGTRARALSTLIHHLRLRARVAYNDYTRVPLRASPLTWWPEPASLGALGANARSDHAKTAGRASGSVVIVPASCPTRALLVETISPALVPKVPRRILRLVRPRMMPATLAAALPEGALGAARAQYQF